MLFLWAPSPYYSDRDVHHFITRILSYIASYYTVTRTTIKPYATIINVGIVHCLRLTLHMTFRC
jgi:hypothetical protein